MISADFVEKVLTNPVMGLSFYDAVVEGDGIRGFAAPAAIYPQAMASQKDDPMHTVFKDYARIYSRQRRAGKKTVCWNDYLTSIGLENRAAVERMIASRRRMPGDPPVPEAKIYPLKKAEDPENPMHDFFLGYQREKWRSRKTGKPTTPWGEYLMAHGFDSREAVEAFIRRWTA